MDVVEVLIEGGKANPGPPLGPALGPLGVNIKQIVAQVNEQTKAYEGMTVPVKITIAGDTVDISVGVPPTAALIKKEIGLEKAKTDSTTEYTGEISLEQLKKVAAMKREGILAASMKAAVKELVGTCVSMRLKVEGKSPKEIQREISDGVYDEVIGE